MTLDRRTLLTAAAALCVPTAAARTEARWEAGLSLPWPTQEAAGGAWRGEVLIAGGIVPVNGATVALDRVGRFDPKAGRWKDGAKLPFPRHRAALASVFTPRYAAAGFADLFCIGGYRITGAGSWVAIKDMLLFDEVWTALAPMPKFQSEVVAAGLGQLIHVVGGRGPKGDANASYADHGDLDLHQAYDPEADRWMALRPLPEARNNAAGGVVGGKLYVVGGRSVAGGNLSRLDCYDPASDSWQTLKPMPEVAAGLSAAVVKEKLYVLGGEGGPTEDGFGEVTASCWSYDPKTDDWTAEPGLPTPRHGIAVAAIGDRIYTAGGGARTGGGEPTAVLEILTP
ncbi:kelch repeat-containing protein [soil metagenome]